MKILVACEESQVVTISGIADAMAQQWGNLTVFVELLAEVGVL